MSFGKAPKLIVVGGGIIGMSTALAFAERGYAVTILDKNSAPAQGTSNRNGAQLSYAFADAMASPTMLKMGPKILGGGYTGIKFRMKPSLANARWMFDFAMQSSQSAFLSNTAKTLTLALDSKQQMDVWRNRYGFRFSNRQAGKLQLMPNAQAIALAEAVVALKQKAGFTQTILSAQEARKLEPTLDAFTGNLAGAIYTPSEEVGDPNQFASGVMMRLVEMSEQNQFIGRCAVTGLKIANGQIVGIATTKGEFEADIFVFATGFDAPIFANDLGVDIPVVPVAGYSLTFDRGANAPNTSITDVEGKAVITPLGNQVRIAGFADIGSTDSVPKAERIHALRDVLESRFPGAALSEGEGDPWIGHRPTTPDSQPIISGTKLSNAFVNCGHGTLGWTLAAGSAARLCAIVEKQIGAANENSNPLNKEIATEISDQAKVQFTEQASAVSA